MAGSEKSLKKKIIEKAKGTFKHHKERIPASSQLEQYQSVAQEADLFDEYDIFLKYQLTRNVKDEKVRKALLEDVSNIQKEAGDEWKSAVTYYFGIMKRLKKIEEGGGSV